MLSVPLALRVPAAYHLISSMSLDSKTVSQRHKTSIQHTFFPGFPSTSPTTFSVLPTIVSTTFSVFVRGFLTVVVVVVVVVAALGLATRPVAVARGLEVLAVVFLLGVRALAMASTTRGLELPLCGVLVWVTPGARNERVWENGY
jgi:hypothetical protein